MKNPFRKKQPEPTLLRPSYEDSVDFDQDSIPMVDGSSDPTTRFMMLTMRHGAIAMDVDPSTGEWVLHALERGGQVFTGRTQMEAILRAEEALDA